jgi:amino acid permease
MIIGDLLTSILGILVGPEFNAAFFRQVIMASVVLVILYPLTLLKKMDSLKYASYVAMGCAIFLCIVVFVLSFTYVPSDENHIYYFKASANFLGVLPIMGFAFTFHSNIFPIREEMREPEKASKGIRIAVFLCGLIYLIVAICGFLSFTAQTKGNILLNYPENNLVVNICTLIPSLTPGKLVLSILVALSYPVLAAPSKFIGFMSKQ